MIRALGRLLGIDPAAYNDWHLVWLGPWGAVRPDLDSGLLVQLPVNMAGSEELVGLTLRADKAATPAQQEVITAIHALAAERQQSSLAPA